MPAVGLVTSKTSPIKKVADPDWSKFTKLLSSPAPGLKDGPGWVPAKIDVGPRRADRVQSTTVIALDVEGINGSAPPDLESVRGRLENLGYDAHLHTSYNHAPDAPRYRVIVRLDEPMAPVMLKQALAALADNIGLADCWDRQCSDPARLFYLPRCPKGREHLFQAFTVEGRPLPIGELQQLIGQSSNANVLPFPTLSVDDEKSLPSFPETPENIERVRSQLSAISADCDRETWRNSIWALLSTGWDSAYKLAQEWSQTAPDLFDQKEFDKVVSSFKPDGGITLGSLQHYAKEAGWKGETLLASASKQRFTFRSLEELRNQPPLQWRVKGLMPNTGVVAIFGSAGSGKTFLTLQLLASIAKGEEFFGFKTVSCPVVYLALEGSAGIGKRIKAYEQHYGLRLPENFKIVTDRLSLLTSDATQFARAVIDNSLGNGVIAIDTLAQASAGADENTSGDMGLIISNAQLLQELTGAVVILVHHSGKDASRGARGHSSLTAALDGAIEVKKTQTGREWIVTKSKDAEDGLRRSFRLEQVQLGLDSDGDPITSCVIAPDQTALFSKPKLTGTNQAPVWTAVTKSHETGDVVTYDELQKLADEAIPKTSNKGQRIKETIQAFIDKGYLTLTGDGYLIN